MAACSTQTLSLESLDDGSCSPSATANLIASEMASEKNATSEEVATLAAEVIHVLAKAAEDIASASESESSLADILEILGWVSGVIFLLTVISALVTYWRRTHITSPATDLQNAEAGNITTEQRTDGGGFLSRGINRLRGAMDGIQERFLSRRSNPTVAVAASDESGNTTSYDSSSQSTPRTMTVSSEEEAHSEAVADQLRALNYGPSLPTHVTRSSPQARGSQLVK